MSEKMYAMFFVNECRVFPKMLDSTSKNQTGSSTVPNIFVCVRGWPHASHGLCAHGVFVFLCLRSRLGQRAMQQLRWRAHSAELSRVLIVLDFPERERSIGTCFSNFGYPSVLISAPNSSGAAELYASFGVSFSKWARLLYISRYGHPDSFSER